MKTEAIRTEYYPDTGCEAAPRCLSCHLPQCKYDLPDGVRLVDIALQSLRTLIAADIAAGLSNAEICAVRGVSARTAQRIRHNIMAHKEARA